MNPGLGSAIFLHFCTFSRAISIDIFSFNAMKVMAIATERDFPWAQWIRHELPEMNNGNIFYNALCSFLELMYEFIFPPLNLKGLK